MLVFQATPDFRGRDVEVVSTPANGLLLYNSKHGEFVCGMTGLTPDRKKPQGLGAPIATQKTTWGKWRPANPQGLVMKSARVAPAGVRLPTAAIPPTHPAFGLTLASTQPATTQRVRRRLTIIGTGKPIAVDVESLSQRPSAVMVDDQPAVLLRADASGPTLRAFSRKLLDMTLRLEPKKDAKLADVRMRDLETDCLWSSAGVAVGGNPAFRGRRLSAIPVDQDVDYEVLKWWVPEIEIYSEPAPPPSTKPVSTATTKPSRKSGKTKAKAK